MRKGCRFIIVFLLIAVMLSTLGLPAFAATPTHTFDFDNPYDSHDAGLWHNQRGGLIGQIANVTYSVFIPRAAQPWAPHVTVMIPNGMTAQDFSVNDPRGIEWIRLANLNEFIVLFYEPFNGGDWNLNVAAAGSTIRDEVVALDNLYAAISSKVRAPANPNAIYTRDKFHMRLVGYEEGGAMALQMAAARPALLATVAVVNATEANSEYITTVGNQITSPFLTDSATLGRTEMNLLAKDVEVPVWIVSTSATANAFSQDYFIASNKAVAATANPLTTAVFESNSNSLARVWVTRGADAAAITEANLLESFLNQNSRMLGWPGGALKQTVFFNRSNAKGPGYYEVNKKIGADASGNDFWRRWIVYEPANLPAGDVPLVLILHGYSGSGYGTAEESYWADVANEHGFIAIFPQAYPNPPTPAGAVGNDRSPSWNCAPAPSIGGVWGSMPQNIATDDVEYLREVIAWAKAEYNIDEERVFGTGHSNGASMIMHAILHEPTMFAAIAPVGWMQRGTAATLEPADTQIPIWIHKGEFDSANGSIGSSLAAGNANRLGFDFWKDFNGIEATENTTFAATRTFAKGAFMTTAYLDKNEVPMVQFTSVTNSTHAYMEEQSWAIWEDFFVNFARRNDGTVLYQGTPVLRDDDNNGIENAIGITKVYGHGHMVEAIAIEYTEDIVAPGIDGFHIIDSLPTTLGTGNAFYKATPQEAVIAAVYTNDEPAVRADKTSVEGNYLIVEIAHSSSFTGTFYDRVAGAATFMHPTAGAGQFRRDYSGLVVTQLADIKNADGDVVSLANKIPTLKYEELIDLELDRFEHTTLASQNGSYDIYYSVSFPENYDPNKSYPMLVYVTGTGGRINRALMDADGNFLNQGNNLVRERGALPWLHADEDMIIVSHQLFSAANATLGINDLSMVHDTAYLIDHFIDNYNVDATRIYGAGSSWGAYHMSQVIYQNPDVFAAYIQHNGVFTASVFSFMSPFNKFSAVAPLTLADEAAFWAWAENNRAAPEVYMPRALLDFAGIVENRIPVWVMHGINDNTTRVAGGASVYEVLREIYAAEGLSDDEINNLVRMNLFTDAQIRGAGFPSMHDAVKYVSETPALLSAMMEWTLSQQGSAKPILTTGNNSYVEIGEEFLVPVYIDGLADGAFRAFDAVIEIDDPNGKFDFIGVEDSAFTGPSIRANRDGDTLRLALTIVNDVDVMNLNDRHAFSLKFSVSDSALLGDALTVSFNSFNTYDAERERVPFRLVRASTTVTVATEPALTVVELYTGDGADLIDTGKMAVSVAFAAAGLTADSNVMFGDVQFYYKEARTDLTGGIVFVGIVDADTDFDDLADFDAYTIDADGGEAIIFGDTNGTGLIDAQDALNILDAWLRVIPVDEDIKILRKNVNADGRIDTADVLAVVDFFLNGRTFDVVTR